MIKPLLCLFAALIGAASVYGQGTMIQSETRLVVVDTVVLDKKGNYLRDLTQKDFKVFEDNKEQVITSFSYESGAAGQDESRKHYTLLFFDDSTVGAALQSSARQAAREFIKTNLGPNRVMALAEFGAALKVTQNFTDDPERLTQALAGSQFAGSRTATGAAVLGDYAIRNVLEGLRSTMQGLAGLPGRKTLIFVSGGYPGTGTTLAEITAIIEAANRANVAIYPVLPALGQTQFMEDAAPADTSAYTRRPRGVRGEGPTDNSTEGVQQVLYSLANGSGGFVINAAADLSSGLAKAGKEQEEHYSLGYTPQKDAAPGACHTLKVKVDKPGDVRSRSGYCEGKTQDLLSGTPTERDLEARMTANAAPTVKGASMLAPFVYIAASTARVNVALEVPPGAIQFAKDKGKFRATLNVVGIAYLPDGTVKARFSDSVKQEFDDKAEADLFAAKPFHYEKQFKMAPGAYDFKLVFSSSANQFGRLETPLTIEPWDPAKFGLSELVLSRNARPANPSAAGLDLEAPEDSVPLIADGMRITPSGSNRFRKSEKCYVYAEMYEPALAVPGVKQGDVPAIGVRMELLDPKTAAVKKDLGLLRLRVPAPIGSPSVPMGLALPVAQMDAGSYRLRVTAIDAKGHESARTVDIQIEN